MYKYLWIAVEADEYELPLAVADTAEELGKIFGVKKNSVMSSALKQCNGRINGLKYIRIEREE